jgi:hypothetical protein
LILARKPGVFGSGFLEDLVAPTLTAAYSPIESIRSVLLDRNNWNGSAQIELKHHLIEKIDQILIM